MFLEKNERKLKKKIFLLAFNKSPLSLPHHLFLLFVLILSWICLWYPYFIPKINKYLLF